MKKFISLLLIIVIFNSCDDKDVIVIPPISQLPSPTQTGANTFGCLIDGKVFKPGYQNNSITCFYQFNDGEYYFFVSGNNTKNNVLTGVSIGTEGLSIFQGQTLDLYARIPGNAFGILSNLDDNTGIYQINTTSTINTGKLTISKLDFTHNIVSGTFWYDVKDNQNVVHQIREGRFDMQFPQ